jgi:hypothetical protein
MEVSPCGWTELADGDELVPAFGLATTVALGILFLRSGVAKLRQPDVVATIEDYHVLPKVLVGPSAASLPWFELSLGFVLLAGVLSAIALWVTAAVLGLFAGAMAINVVRGRRIECGCQLGFHNTVSWALVGRNLILAMIAAVAAIVTPGAGLQTLLFGISGLSSNQALAELLTMALALVAARLITALLKAGQHVSRTPSGRLVGIRHAAGSALSGR